MEKKPVKTPTNKKPPRTTAGPRRVWSKKVDRDKSGYCSAVVPLLYAGVPDPRGRVFTTVALRAIANGNPALYRYDETMDALVGVVGVQVEDPRRKLRDTEPMVAVHDLPAELRAMVKTVQDDLANETDAACRHLVVQYTKVWVLLCNLIDSRSLAAEDLCHALDIASRVGNDPDEILTTQYDNAGVAHGLLNQFLSPYDPDKEAQK